MKCLNRVGEKHITNEGYEIEIIEYFNASNCSIRFDNETILKNLEYRNIKKGQIKNPFHKSVYNVGYTGEGIYKLSFENSETKLGKIWRGMIERCYSNYRLKLYPTYKDCSVDERWHNFQNFAKWYEENYKPEYMESWHLDKDILVKGNKIYSPETCCFVPPEINTLFVKNNINRGRYPIGVNKVKNRFVARVNLIHKRLFLGSFLMIEEAFQAYKIAKENHIKELANKYKNQITEACYQALLNYNVEITD